jgi:2Fe-2S ferredoxin
MISFKKDIEPINTDDKSSLMEQLTKNNIPVATSCDGEGVCGMCRINIISGEDQLSKKTELEQQFFNNHEFPKSYRLSCQCKAKGPVIIDTDYW